MRIFLITGLVVVGCAEPPTHGNAALGVADFAVRSTASELDIAGADAQGTVLAHLHLRIGMVTPEEWDTPTTGRELSLEIMGKLYPPFASAGLAPLMLPLTRDPRLDTFVLDPFVAQVLSDRGIAFGDHVRTAEPEVGYAQCSANSTTTYVAPCNGWGSLATCYDFSGSFDGHTIFSQKVLCANLGAERVVRMCASPGATTPCGTAGINGCATCGPWTNGGTPECSSDSCIWADSGSPSCPNFFCASTCNNDIDCCGCGGGGHCSGGACILGPGVQ
jgi:hypothetical protein